MKHSLLMNNILRLFLVLLVVSSCSKYQKLMKSEDWREKYEGAVAYYEKKDYYRTIQLLDQILPIIRGTQEAEYANFIYAYAHFWQKQHILSAHHFKTFVEVYNRSQYALEAEFMHAFSLYMQSPNYKLDQTVTYEALAEFQKFINKYPYHDKAKHADTLISELQVKLETKAYENAKLYVKTSNYKAALIAVDNFEKDFPDSRYNDELLYLSVKTAFDLARQSIASVQSERYQNVVDRHQKLVDRYPKSRYLKDSEDYYSKSIQELSKFATAKK